MVGCCPCCGGRQPRDGAGKYAPVEQDEHEDEDADYCDDAPQVKGLDNPFAALQALRHLDFDAADDWDNDDGDCDRPPDAGRSVAASQARLTRPAFVPQSTRGQDGQQSRPPRTSAAPAIALRTEAGRRAVTIGDMEIDIGWRKPAANEVLSAAAAKARSGLAAASGGSRSKSDTHKQYGRGQQHPASMRKLIGGGTAHPEFMTRQLKMQFDPAAGGMKGRMSSWKAKMEAKGKEALEKAKEKTRTNGVT